MLAQLVVGTATANPGQRAYGALDVAAGVDSAAPIAVTAINGAKPGRTVAFITGAHGTEYASIVALTRLANRIDPAALTGAVIIVPLLNTASFERMIVHVNPVDGKGMNASYPGDPKGTQTDRVLAAVAEQVIKRADVVVDLHGGDIDEDLRPYSYWMRSGDASQDSAGRALALAFGIDHVIVRDVDLTLPASRRSASGYALSLGKTVLVAEAGRSGLVLDTDVGALVDGSLNLLKTLRLLPGAVKPMTRVTWLGNDARVRAERPGIFQAVVARDTRVTKGQRIGFVTDYWGRPAGDILAPIDGLVTFVRGVPSLWKDATIVNVAAILTDPPPPFRRAAPQ
jgi:hypothetical protein